MKISYDLGLLQSESPWQRNDAITFFHIFVFYERVFEIFWNEVLRIIKTVK